MGLTRRPAPSHRERLRHVEQFDGATHRIQRNPKTTFHVPALHGAQPDLSHARGRRERSRSNRPYTTTKILNVKEVPDELSSRSQARTGQTTSVLSGDLQEKYPASLRPSPRAYGAGKSAWRPRRLPLLWPHGWGSGVRCVGRSSMTACSAWRSESEHADMAGAHRMALTGLQEAVARARQSRRHRTADESERAPCDRLLAPFATDRLQTTEAVRFGLSGIAIRSVFDGITLLTLVLAAGGSPRSRVDQVTCPIRRGTLGGRGGTHARGNEGRTLAKSYPLPGASPRRDGP